jgi:lysyl endopeptidase
MKKVYTLTLGALFGISAIAQTVDLGGPYSWRPKAVNAKFIDTRVMPGYDQAAIDAEDVINDETKEGPWRFGYKYETDFSLSNSGTWTELSNGNRLWQLELVCDGAMTVNLIFENLFIPEGAYIYLYDVAKSNRVGAYTNRNNNSEKILGTELVHGDHIVVEYFEPAAVSGQGTFTVANVIHGYRSLTAVQGDLLKAFESSGNCNVDVNCTLGDGWENEIRSVAMIVVSGNGICTGALINNTCDDGTPYFLTANHCVGGGSTASWAFRFNWESPPGTEVCQAVGTSVNPGPPYDQTANGATQLYTSAASDVAFLQITNMTLTDAQNWNCFYAGWDNSDALTVTQATGIHHPSGDLKKICREDNAPTHQAWGSPSAACWRIANWDQGVTEPGSSGSPLFDQNHRIIGQLYGGGAACSGTNDNNQPDWYGRFGVTWPNIDNWLAPASCGTAPTTNDGWDPVTPPANDDAGITAVSSPVGNYCTDTFDPIVTLRNYGANTLTSVTINYNIDGGTNNVFAWTGSLAPGSNLDVTLPTMTTTAGAHTFNVSTSTPNTVADSNPANDDAASNYNATVGGDLVTLTIDTDCWGYETAWQILDVSNAVVMEGGNISIVPGGDQIAGSGDPGAYGDETTITESFCLAVGCYDLVVYDDWGDGMNGGGCPVDGSYELTDASANVLAAMITSSFGVSESQNFCITSACTGTAAGTTLEENCFDDCDGTITVTVTGGTAPFTYDIGSGAQAGNVFTGLCQGSYNVVIEDGVGCVQTITVDLAGPSEIAGSTVVTDEALGNDGAINLTVSGGTGTLDFAWTGPGGFTSTSEDLTGLASGTYAVTITDDNGCSIMLTTIFVGSSVGLNETDASQFTVYPNPSNSIFNVDLGAFAGNETQLILQDVTGRIVQTMTANDDSVIELNLGEKAPGTYYLTIVSGDTQTVLTLIKTN